MTTSTIHLILVALALVSGCTASFQRASTTALGNALHQANIDGKQMPAALLQDAPLSVDADVTGLHGPGSSLQNIHRQAGDGCTSDTRDTLKCWYSCDRSSLKCTSPSSSGCQAASYSCSLPGCCASATRVGTKVVLSICYNGCCLGVEGDQNIVTPIPCNSGSSSAAGTGAGAGSNPTNAPAPKSGDGPLTSPGASPNTTPSCFAGHVLVELESGLHRRMDQLLIGDRVKVAERTFSDVFMFTHKLHNAIAMFVVIRTASGHSISLTPGHYIYVNGVLTSAASVKIGDELDLSTSAHSTVISVSETVQTGLFNPQTLHGDIAVNGIIASTYTTAVSPVLGHAWLTPFRMVYSALGSTTAMLENGAEFAASILPGGSTTY
jgi:Hint module